MRALVERVIAQVNELQPDPQPTDDDAPILGGPLDSLGLVELLVRLEEAVEGEHGLSPALLGNPDVICEGGPLDNVAALISYLEGVVGD